MHKNNDQAGQHAPIQSAELPKDVAENEVCHSPVCDERCGYPRCMGPETLSASDYEEVLADHRRLVRELDVLLNGEDGAAKQASLCDIVAQVATAQKNRISIFAQQQASTVPAGCKMVPIEATEAMLRASVSYREVDADDEITHPIANVHDRVYRAMLAAAPQSPVSPAHALTDAEIHQNAMRYQWLRHADLDAMAAQYWPGGPVPEGEALDVIVDAAIAAHLARKG